MVDTVPENPYMLPQSPEENQEETDQLYHQTISQDLLRLADYLASKGQLTEAFKNYSKAFKLWPLYPPEVLQCLAEALCLSHSNRTLLAHMSSEESILFRCFLCKAVLSKPTTLTCGHTFCHKCLQNNETWTCRLCGVTDYILDRKNCPPTTLLTNLVDKVLPKHCQSERLRQKGKKCMQRREYLKAIDLFTQALQEAPSSHLALSSRSTAYSSLEQYNLALRDAEKVIEMQPTWPKGHYRKGCILSDMHKCEEAVTALLDCLAIYPCWVRPKEKLYMSLHQVLSDDVRREHELCSSSLPHSMTKRAQMSRSMGGPDGECSPSCIGETSDPHRSSTASSSYSWYQSPKPFNKKTNYAQEGGDNKEYEPEEEEEEEGVADHSKAAAAYHYYLDDDSEKSVSDCDELEEEENCCSMSYTHKQFQQQEGDLLLPCDASCCHPQISLLKQDDLQCSLCLNLLYMPLVTPCGHAFCRECLVRSLDHSPQCPLCKQSLSTYLAAHKWNVSECLEKIIQVFFPNELARRKEIHEEEMSRLAQVEDNCELPVFVCTFACPTIRCPLHIFEPRYRLMIRRCLESGSHRFGMATPTSTSGAYSDYGCILKIKNVQLLDDGRSLLDTVGEGRFKVLERGRRDGYNIAKVSFLKDEPIESSERAELMSLEQEVYILCRRWLDTIPPESVRRISEHYGPLPIPQESELDAPNGPSWVWWMITILPIDQKLQVTAMSFTKLYKRLQFIKSAILTIQSKLSS